MKDLFNKYPIGTEIPVKYSDYKSDITVVYGYQVLNGEQYLLTEPHGILSVRKLESDNFNEFLKMNKEIINNITPKNPTISKNDEWVSETEWDDVIKRPCTVKESIEESLKEVKLMREGKLPKKTWDEHLEEYARWGKEISNDND